MSPDNHAGMRLAWWLYAVPVDVSSWVQSMPYSEDTTSHPPTANSSCPPFSAVQSMLRSEDSISHPPTPDSSCSPCPVEKTLFHTFQLLFLPALPFSAGQSTPCWEDTTSYPPTPISSFPPLFCNVPWTLGWGGWGGKLIDMSQHYEHLHLHWLFPITKRSVCDQSWEQH